MKVGVSTATFFSRHATEDSLPLIKRCKAQAAEVFLTTFSEYTEEFGNMLKGRIDGLDIHSIHTLNSQFEPQLYNAMPRTKGDAEKIFREALSVGRQIGAKFYTFHGPARLKRFREIVFDFDRLSKRTMELYSIAEEYGITLSFENVHWAYYYYPGFFKEIKKHCKGLKATLDIKQAFQSHHDYRDYIKDMGTDISTVHICDYDKDYNLCPLGKGIFDFKELIERLKDLGLDIPLMIELYAGDYKSVDDIELSCAYLQSLI